MILNKYGDTFQYDGIDYAIGDIIVATDASEYEGLVGRIIEIRDGADKDTENETPDIYCSFEVPLLAEDIKTLEETFSLILLWRISLIVNKWLTSMVASISCLT